MGDHEVTLQCQYDDISMKTKLILSRLGGSFGTLWFDRKSFVSKLWDSTPCWDYKPTKAIHFDRPGVYTSDKVLTLSTIDKIHIKCDFIDGGVVNGIREPIFF